MRSILKNSLLVLVLTGLFAVPMTGFGFTKYTPPQDPRVLGISDYFERFRPAKKLQLQEQLELNLNLSQDPYQKFYNVVPEKYLEEGYQVFIIFPNQYVMQGVSMELVENELSTDLLVFLADGTKVSSITATLLVLK